MYVLWANSSVSYILSMLPCLYFHLYVFISHVEVDFFLYLLPFSTHMHSNIRFNHRDAVQVEYLCDVFKCSASAFRYLNDNSKEITIKMIPCKYVLPRCSSLEVWNIDRSASSWCFWLLLQHMSCLYSCAHIYSCIAAVYVWEMLRLIWYSFQGDQEICLQLSDSLCVTYFSSYPSPVWPDLICLQFISNHRVDFLKKYTMRDYVQLVTK